MVVTCKIGNSERDLYAKTWTGVLKRISEYKITINPSNKRSLKQAPTNMNLLYCSGPGHMQSGGQPLICKEQESALLSVSKDSPRWYGGSWDFIPISIPIFPNLKNFKLLMFCLVFLNSTATTYVFRGVRVFGKRGVSLPNQEILAICFFQRLA